MSSTSAELSGSWRSAIGKETLGVEDFDEGQEVALTIANVTREDVPDPKTGRPRPKAVLHFRGTPRGLVLNVTNAQRITAIAGTNRVEKWAGIKITLRLEPGKLYGGGTGPTVRVKEEPRQARPRAAEGGEAQPD